MSVEQWDAGGECRLNMSKIRRVENAISSPSSSPLLSEPALPVEMAAEILRPFFEPTDILGPQTKNYALGTAKIDYDEITEEKPVLRKRKWIGSPSLDLNMNLYNLEEKDTRDDTTGKEDSSSSFVPSGLLDHDPPCREALANNTTESCAYGQWNENRSRASLSLSDHFDATA